MKGIYGLGLLICFVFSANAQDSAFKTDFVKCAKKSEMSSRLACFDRLAEESGLLNEKGEAKGEVENWEVVEKTSPIDDSQSVFLTTYADEPVRTGYESIRPSLHIRCQEGSIDVYIAWGMFIGTDSARLTTRYDSYNADEDEWKVSTDNTATFARNSILEMSFLAAADRFIARVTPYGESPVVASFDVSGLSEIVGQVRKACDLD